MFMGRVLITRSVEGALKLRNFLYHAEGYPAGMKQGAGFGKQGRADCGDFWAVISSMKNEIQHQEVRARGARTFIVATEGDEEAREVRMI